LLKRLHVKRFLTIANSEPVGFESNSQGSRANGNWLAQTATNDSDQPRSGEIRVVDEESARLVARWQKGEEQAAVELFQRYTHRLVALAQSRLSERLTSRVDAEDVVQSVYRSFFVRARAGHYVFERSGDLWHLLVAITLKKVCGQAHYHSAEKRALEREEQGAEEAANWRGLSVQSLAQEPTPLAAAALADEIAQVMSRLETGPRRMFELRLQGYSLEEIAADCACSLRTVKRGLSQIRQELERFRAAATA
jgi:RNA polymerase sigma factor (sigma-70 family)